MIRLSIVGSTGAVGRQALEVVAAHPRHFQVEALSAGRNAGLLLEQARAFRPRVVALEDRAAAGELREALRGSGIEVLAGPEGVEECARWPSADVVLSAAGGSAGIRPTWAALQAGKRVALANKETLVAAGEVVRPLLSRTGARIIPVDSEHSAIFQCLEKVAPGEVSRIVLTASGGPFLGRRREELERVTPEEALAHPVWRMGREITVDSATLMNKGLEIIEAHFLFGLPYGKIEVVIHPEGIVHGLVELRDGGWLGQMSVPDMRLPIQYALGYPERLERVVRPLDWVRVGRLTFLAPDEETFPSLRLARRAGEAGGSKPAFLLGVKEAGVKAFLERRLGFLDLVRVMERALEEHEARPVSSLDDVLAVLEEGRRKGEELCTSWR